MPLNFQKYFVCFLDILGFRKIVEGNQTSKIDVYLAISQELRKYWSNVQEKEDFLFYSFSDSIVIAVKLEGLSEDQYKEKLKHLSIVVASLQFHLAKNDIWLRGGISGGQISLNREEKDFLLFGKAFIQAYDLENLYAKFPRVLRDSNLVSFCGFSETCDLIQYINKNNNYDNWKGDLVFDWPLVSSQDKVKPRIKHDLPLFIDYLEYLFQSFGDFENNKHELFQALLKKVLTQNINHYEKYRWVTDYYLTKLETRLALGKTEYIHDFKKSLKL